MDGVVDSLTEEERALLRELRRKAGEAGGRPLSLTPEQIEEAQRLRDSGETVDAVAARFGVNRKTVMRNTTGQRRSLRGI